jgi:hypothetical protein
LFNPDFKDMLSALSEAQIDFLLGLKHLADAEALDPSDQ